MQEQRATMPRSVFWILPFVFVIHDTEELATMPAWLAAHRSMLDSLSREGALAAWIVEIAPATTARAAIAISLVFVLLLLVTVGVALKWGRAWFLAYCGFLGLLFLHVFTHAGQALVFRGYAPGLITAVLAVLPGTVLIYRHLFAARLLDRRTTILTALGGFALLVPGALAAWAFGRFIGG